MGQLNRVMGLIALATLLTSESSAKAVVSSISAATTVVTTSPAAPVEASQPVVPVSPQPQAAGAPVAAPAPQPTPTSPVVNVVPVKTVYVAENQPVQIIDSQGRLLQIIYLKKK